MISYLHGNSPAVRRVSMGRIIVVLFWKKIAIPCQLKPGILSLTIGRSQSNFRVVLFFVSPEKKAGQLGFDCRLVDTSKYVWWRGLWSAQKNVIYSIPLSRPDDQPTDTHFLVC